MGPPPLSKKKFQKNLSFFLIRKFRIRRDPSPPFRSFSKKKTVFFYASPYVDPRLPFLETNLLCNTVSSNIQAPKQLINHPLQKILNQRWWLNQPVLISQGHPKWIFANLRPGAWVLELSVGSSWNARTSKKVGIEYFSGMPRTGVACWGKGMSLHCHSWKGWGELLGGAQGRGLGL